MIKAQDIKPCGGVSTVVIVEEGAENPGGSSTIEMRSNGTHIQYRPVGGGEWTNIIAISTLVGPSGTPGAPGSPGPSVELQANETHIQWRVAGGSWANLIALSEITGPSGGGSSISNPRVVYVRTDGNDGTGEIGNPGKPFLTATAAYDAGVAGGVRFLLDLGVGVFNLEKPSTQLSFLFFGARGCGYSLVSNTSLTELHINTSNGLTTNANGIAGGGSADVVRCDALRLQWNASGQSVQTNDSIGGYTGGTGGTLLLEGDALWSVSATGGSASDQASGETGYGGVPGAITIRGGVVEAVAAFEGEGYSSGSVVPPVMTAQIYLDDCDCRPLSSIPTPYDIHAGRCALPSGLTVTDKGGNSIW